MLTESVPVSGRVVKSPHAFDGATSSSPVHLAHSVVACARLCSTWRDFGCLGLHAVRDFFARRLELVVSTSEPNCLSPCPVGPLGSLRGWTSCRTRLFPPSARPPCAPSPLSPGVHPSFDSGAT